MPGGLAGRLSGKTEILDCQVYLSPTRDKLSTKTEQDIWLRGSTAAVCRPLRRHADHPPQLRGYRDSGRPLCRAAWWAIRTVLP